MIVMEIIEVLASFVESFLGIWMNTEVLGNGADKRKIAGVSAICTTVCWILNQYNLFSFATTVIGEVCIVVAVYYICRIKIFDSIVLTACYMVVLYIIDFFVISVFGVVWDEELFAHFVTSGTSVRRILLIVLSKMLLGIVAYIVVKKWLCKAELPVRKMWVGAALSVLLVLYLVNSTFFEVDTDLLLAWLFFFGIVLIAIYAIVQYLYYIQEKNRLNLALERNDMQLSVYNQLIQDYQEKQIFYHDLKNQYLIVKNYIQNKEYAKAEEYLGSLEQESFAVTYQKRTGIQAVDILLECKIKEAETWQIHVDVNVDMLRTELPEQEWIALLGNALDNAIEACKGMKGDLKWIRLTIRQIQEMTMIKVENSYEQSPKEKAGQFISTKELPQLHGIGIKSMRAIVEKYDGKMKTEYADGVFSLVISFFS